MNKENDDKKYYPLHMDYLPERFHQKAIDELNETPETREVDLDKLRVLLSADKFTAGIKFEEDFLQLFLRYRKYNSSKAFQALRKFITFRKNISYLFQAIPDVYFKDNPSIKFLSVLPYRCADGCVILVFELGKWNPNELPLEDMETMMMLPYFQLLRCPITQISGFKAIFDFKDTIKHFRYATPQNLRLFYNAGFNCIPGRYKEIHCINKSVVLTSILIILKPFIPEKIRKRMFFHSNPEELLNYFPSSNLPTQYGGSLDHYHDSKLMRKMNADCGNYPQEGQKNYF